MDLIVLLSSFNRSNDWVEQSFKSTEVDLPGESLFAQQPGFLSKIIPICKDFNN